jgi:hypothetical protein
MTDGQGKILYVMIDSMPTNDGSDCSVKLSDKVEDALTPFFECTEVKK